MLRVDGKRPAAVLLIICMIDGEPHLIFTKRTDKVAVHKSEVSFPGGAVEPYDESLAATALRETKEELGITIEGTSIIGRLDDHFAMGSNFVISPFVAVVEGLPPLNPDPFEVAEAFAAPLSSLLEPGATNEGEWMVNGRLTTVRSYRYKDYCIWGATARILKQFLDKYQSGEMVISLKTLVPSPEAATGSSVRSKDGSAMRA